MKKTCKKLLSVILVLTVALSSSLFAFAVAQPDAADLDVAHATNLTLGTTQVTEEALFRFVPTQTGYYHFESNSAGETDPFVKIFDSDCVLFSSDDDISETEYDFSLYVMLNAGQLYYVLASVYKQVGFNLSVTALGAITSARLVSEPDVTTLYDGMDYEVFYNGNYEKCVYNRTDYEGFSVEITFTDSSKLTVNEYEVFDFLSSEDVITQTGYTEVFSHNGVEFFSVHYTFAPNPVKKIEVVSAPDKTDYVFGVDGELYLGSTISGNWFYPDIELDGLLVKISYTDGSSKTVAASAFEKGEDNSYSCYVDGRYMWTDATSVSSAGKTSIEINYFGSVCSFDINIKRAPFAQNIFWVLCSMVYNLLRYFNIDLQIG